MKFNEKLKFLREEKGFTQDEIASKLNVARQSVSKWETGINEPDFDTLKKICIILDCSISELIDDDKDIVTNKDMKKEKATRWFFYGSIMLFIFTTLSLIGFIRVMHDQIIMHWNIDGSIRYGSKYEAFIMLIPLIFGLLFNIAVRRYLSKNKHYEKYKLSMQVTTFIIQIFMSVLTFVFLFVTDTYEVEMFETLSIIICISLCTSITMFCHPKFNKRNLFFGFKTDFTLSNDEAWNKIHSLGAILFTIFALIGYVFILIFAGVELITFFILIPVAAIIPLIIYHEVLRKKSKNK